MSQTSGFSKLDGPGVRNKFKPPCSEREIFSRILTAMSETLMTQVHIFTAFGGKEHWTGPGLKTAEATLEGGCAPDTAHRVASMLGD